MDKTPAAADFIIFILTFLFNFWSGQTSQVFFSEQKNTTISCFHCKMNSNLLLCLLWTVTTRRASQSRTGTRTTVLWSWTWAKPLWRTVGRRSRGHLRRRPATARCLYKGHLILTFDATRLPACRPYTPQNNFPAVRSCQLVQGEIPEKSQQDINSPLPGKRKTRNDLCNGDWLFKRYGGWWKNENVVVALLCCYSDLCAKNVNYFPVMSPFVCGIVLSNNQWSLRQRSMQFKMPSIFSVS